MRRSLSTLWFLVLLLWAPGPAIAQPADDRLVLMTRYDVDLEDDAAFRDYLRARVQAARQMGLPAERGWTALRTDNTWLVLQPIGSLAALQDFDSLAREVKGTPGEATLKAAQASLAGVNYSVESRVITGPADWRHEPRNPAPANFAFVQEFRVKPGAEEAFGRYRDQFIAFLRDIRLPYRYEAYRPVVGRNAVVGIVWPDDMVRYYSEFSPAVFVRKYAERFAPLAGGSRPHINDMDTTLYSVMHDFSYRAAPGAAAAAAPGASFHRGVGPPAQPPAG